MPKYQYDKRKLKGLSVFPFLKEAKLREGIIADGKDEDIRSIYNENILSKKLHPGIQFLKVKEIKDEGFCRTYKLVPNKEKGCSSLAPFRPGQYLLISMVINGVLENRRYTLGGNPHAVFDEDGGSYTITVARIPNGYFCEHIFTEWKVDSEVISSEPHGTSYYQELRDGKNIVGVCGASISEFISLAYDTIYNGYDYKLTVFYESMFAGGITLKDELDKLVKESSGKFKVIYLALQGNAEGVISGPFRSEMIKEYVDSDNYTLFFDAAKNLNEPLMTEIKKLNLPIKRLRTQIETADKMVLNNSDYPEEYKDKVYKLTIYYRDKKVETTCAYDETLLHAIEQANIAIISNCGGGKCGYCRSRLISGNVYIPKDSDGRLFADLKFNWIHPCSSFPLSDIEIEVFPIK